MSPDPPAGRGETPYEETTEVGYGDTFASTCQVTEMRLGVMLNGTCPRCTHPISYPLVEKYFRWSGVSRQQPSAPDGRRVVQMLCTCGENHARRPDDEDGCGAYWNLTLEGPPS
jgi:hypothetical protein